MYMFWLISCSRWKMWVWVFGCKSSTILHQFNLHTTGGSFNLDVQQITTRLTINLLAKWCACGTILGRAKLAAATSDDIVEESSLALDKKQEMVRLCLRPAFFLLHGSSILVFSNHQMKQIGQPMWKFERIKLHGLN